MLREITDLDLSKRSRLSPQVLDLRVIYCSILVGLNINCYTMYNNNMETLESFANYSTLPLMK